MFKFLPAAAAAALLCVSASVAGAATIASIDADGILLFSDGEDQVGPVGLDGPDVDLPGGVIVVADVLGQDFGLSLDSLASYTYTATLWLCQPDGPEASDSGGFLDEGGCDRNEDPILPTGEVSAGDILSFLGDSPDGGATYGEIIGALIGDLFEDGYGEIYDTGVFLAAAILDFELHGGDAFAAFLAAYLGEDEACAQAIANDSLDGEAPVCAGFPDIAEQPADLAFSLRLTVEGDPSVIPLPASFPLILAGLGALGFVGRRRKP